MREPVPKLLILYSTREGQARRIAEAIVAAMPGYVASWCNLHTDAVPVLADYDRVLVAASIRYGHFHPSVWRLLREHRAELDAARAAFFSVCLTARKPGKDSPQTNVYARKFLARTGWQPARAAVFAGALYYSRYTWWQKCLLKFIMWVMRGPTSTQHDLEFTNWQAVQSFAAAWLQDTEPQGMHVERGC